MEHDRADRLDEQLAELDSYLPLIDQLLTQGGESDPIRLDEEGELVVSPLKAEELPASVGHLRQLIESRLPRVELTDMLVERGRPSGGRLDRLFLRTDRSGNGTAPSGP